MWITSRYGVPQGSILGPLLFNVYINDFQSILKETAHTILYTDKTITVTSKNLNVLKDKLNTVMKMISSWFWNNDLTLNLRKTHLIKFTTPHTIEFILSATYKHFRLKVTIM
jgi:hypothetical protein